jgi:hypothetical protein
MVKNVVVSLFTFQTSKVHRKSQPYPPPPIPKKERIKKFSKLIVIEAPCGKEILLKFREALSEVRILR